MSTTAKQVIGIDFGTTNSYFCKYVTEADGHKVRAIDFGHGQLGGIPSTILYRHDKDPLIGAVAEQEWGEATGSERRKYRIRTHFKPDIATNDGARDDAIKYLETIIHQLQLRRVDFFPEQSDVIFGIPAEADDLFKSTLQKLAQLAGYGKIRLVPEPVGALLYHLWNKEISASDAHRGVLVIDFGGGTCDFAYMKQLEVCHAWGDMMLGGRLFDDLFYQWFLEQNPAMHEQLGRSGDEYYVHWMLCRNAKENFSDTMRLNPGDSMRYVAGQIRQYGAFKDLTWEKFVSRAQNYRPHHSFLEYLRQTKQPAQRFLQEDSIDLIQWFRSLLSDGLDRFSIRSSDIERVVLTGGSTQWPFVDEIVCEILHLTNPRQRLLRSENPKAAISEGLAILPSLQKKFEQTALKLNEGLDTFFDGKIEPEIRERLHDVAEHIVNQISAALYDGKISELLYAYREEGGSIARLKQQIESAVRGFEPELRRIIEAELSLLSEGLPSTIDQMVHEWFEAHGIKYYGENLGGHAIRDQYRDAGEGNLPGIEDEMIEVVGAFVIGISATIIAMISGGGGTALIASGPGGMLVGALITIVMGYVVLEYGRDQAREFVEQLDLPAWTLKLLLRDKKLEQLLSDGKMKLADQLGEGLSKAVEEPFAEMKLKILRNIRIEIESLSVINQI